MKKQSTATIQDEDGSYRAAKTGDTFFDPDGHLMMAVPVKVIDDEGTQKQCEEFSIPTPLSFESCQRQIEVH